MKALKILFYIVLSLVALVVLAVLFAPSEKIVERSIVIDAPAEKVYQVLIDNKLSENWDPWLDLDSNQIREYFGEFGDEEYGYSWESEVLGTGKRTLESFEENRSITHDLTLNDWKMDMTAYFNLEPEGESTKVTWGMNSKAGFPFKAMHYMTDKWVGTDYENGLKKLKEFIETSENLDAGVEIGEVEMVSEFGVNYAVVRAEVSFKDMDAFFNGSYGKIYPYLRENGIEPKGPPSAMYYTWDTVASKSNMAVAVPISEVVPMEVEEDSISIGAVEITSNSISHTMIGGYEGSEAAHYALSTWIEENGKVFEMPVMEQYIKGPANETDVTKYETNIIYHFSEAE